MSNGTNGRKNKEYSCFKCPMNCLLCLVLVSQYLERKTVLLLATGSSSDAAKLEREEKTKRKGSSMSIVILQDLVQELVCMQVNATSLAVSLSLAC